jgi:glyoxylase-like metal-dependent hydrolase (beta-lactamase superfamily II)
MYQTLDLHFLDYTEAIASFMIESEDGLILIESGPYSTFRSLENELEKTGHSVDEVKHVLLTHIHFDHAGAAWALAEKGAKIYVHPFGAGHMQDPTKLVASATMIYGDDMDRLWGDMKAIPEEKMVIVENGQELSIGGVDIKAWHTPGHAKHHIAWEIGDQMFTGDVAGVSIGGGPVVPPCPPPDINLEDWNESIDLILSRNPKELILTHYDAQKNPEAHMKALRGILNDWAYWVKDKWEQGMTPDEITPKFVEYTQAQLLEHGVDDMGLKQYEAANPSWMSVAGLVRYWKKQAQK